MNDMKNISEEALAAATGIAYAQAATPDAPANMAAAEVEEAAH